VKKKIKLKRRTNKMVTLGEYAQTYEPQQFKNIADLEAVPLDLEFKEEVKKNSDGEEYVVKYIGLNGEKYRIPNSVITDIKAIKEQKPDCKTVKVTKKGDGLNTRYTVLPLE